MSAQQQANIGKVFSFLREWDRGDCAVRHRLLNTFLTQNAEKTSYELEVEFAQVSSLFLARLTTWMRLTYRSATYLGLQLKAIGVFLSASNHDQYLMEFLEDGGICILLDILSHSEPKQDDKAGALHLLLTVSNAGRSCKEFICESHGVKVIAECLAMSDAADTQQIAGTVLESLSHGNPKYQDQIYKNLIGMVSCASAKAQQVILHILHTVQLKLKTAHHSIIAPVLSMLRSLHLGVQHEAINLILDLKRYDVKAMLLSGLVALLRPIKEEGQQHHITEDMIKLKGSLPEFVQQAAAAKTIRLLAEEDQELSYELLSLGVIQHLLHVMGNREHTDAQIQASLALKHFVHSFPGIREHVHKVMGSTLFKAFMNKADTFYMNMDERQAESLLSNQANISQVLDGNKSVDQRNKLFHANVN